MQGLSPNISMPGGVTSKPWQVNVSCQQTPKLLYGAKADGQRIRIKRGVNGNGTERLRVNITTDVRGARFLQLQNITTNDPGPTSGDDEPAGTLRLDYGNGIRTKAWGIEEGGGMVNRNVVLDPVPCCASYHHAQFKQQWGWRIGESSMGADSSWDASSIDRGNRVIRSRPGVLMRPAQRAPGVGAFVRSSAAWRRCTSCSRRFRAR